MWSEFKLVCLTNETASLYICAPCRDTSASRSPRPLCFAPAGHTLGIDCHTMSVIGPPLAPDPGRKRPLVCISNGDGTCPEEWINVLARCFASVFKEKVAINKPFRGGYITRSHGIEMPWVQIEISQTRAYSNAFKRNCVLEVLRRFCHTVLS